MSTKYRLIRALHYATIALFIAAGFEALKALIFPNLSAWQSHVATVLACAALVFLLTSRGFARERSETQQSFDADRQFDDIGRRGRTPDTITESERRYRSLFENMLEGFAYCEMLVGVLDPLRPVPFFRLART
jgi:membrane protein implicated in regulation of membrane protease activity